MVSGGTTISIMVLGIDHIVTDAQGQEMLIYYDIMNDEVKHKKTRRKKQWSIVQNAMQL